MEFNFKKNGNSIIIYLKGRLDVHHSAEIEKELGRLIAMESASDFLINMKDVEYISSSGLRIIVLARRILGEKKRKLVLCNINSAIRKIFDVVQLTDMFSIFDSEREAVEFLER